jgi:CPA2 family monovalent cation:H+ antiporter-2
MEEHASFSSLLIVLLVSFITPILLNRFKLHAIPVVVAEIIAGLIIGKTGFNLVESDMLLETLSTLGFIYLLFLSGLEIDFSVFAGKKKQKVLPNGKHEPNAIVVAISVFIFILGLSYLLSLMFEWAGFIENTLLMTLVISTISLGVVVPTLKDAEILKSSIGQTILLITVIGDLVTMILLAVFVSVFSAEGHNTWLLLVLFAAGLLLYFLGKFFKHMSFLETMAKGTIQLDTRAVFTLIIVLVALSQQVGAESILGAFLAGTLVSLLSPNPSMVQKLDSFGYGFLIPIFFVMIGVQLNLWELFSDKEVLILIPVLLLAFFVAKIVPSLWLKRWYDTHTVISVGFLLSAKLTLVIAAAKIGERMNLIDTNMSSAIILVAVISSILGPIVFKKTFPQIKKPDKKKVVIIGANRMTLPLSIELDPKQYQTCLYHRKQEKIEDYSSKDSSFSVKELEEFSVSRLKNAGVFDADLLLLATSDDQLNATISEYAKDYGTERIIARIEEPHLNESLREIGIEVYSTFFSTMSLLKALIESPSVINLFTRQENALKEIKMRSNLYNGVSLRNFPYLGDTIIVRIFRDNESIVPHGDTKLLLGDRLIVTGGHEHVEKLKEMLR